MGDRSRDVEAKEQSEFAVKKTAAQAPHLTAVTTHAPD